jgi:hypothetical protein
MVEATTEVMRMDQGTPVGRMYVELAEREQKQESRVPRPSLGGDAMPWV